MHTRRKESISVYAYKKKGKYKCVCIQEERKVLVRMHTRELDREKKLLTVMPLKKNLQHKSATMIFDLTAAPF